MKQNNIKNFAKALLLKYAMMLIYLIGFSMAISEHYILFAICALISFVLLIMMIIYEWKFIAGEMR